MRVLVTGCAGYVGSVLCDRLLQNGCEVIGVDNFLYNNQTTVLGLLGQPNFKFYQLNVYTQRVAVASLAVKADVIIPLAAVVGAPACDFSPHMAVEVNTEAVSHLVRSLSSFQRVIFTNTNSGYGQTDGTSMVTERDPLNPISHYGKTKCDAEKVVLEHPNSVSLRLATVFGSSPRMRFDLMVNDWTEKMMGMRYISSDLFTIYEPHFKRNFVHVRDVGRAICWATSNHKMAGAYNVGLPSANLTKMELAHAIADVVNISRERVVTGDGRDPDQRNYIVSNKKLLDTGFKFQFSLEQGIREVMQITSMFGLRERGLMRNYP